jgi:aspartate aminotransferase-like enzyme
MINHRGPAFHDLLFEVTEGIRAIYKTEGEVLIYPSSGTGVMEAAVANFIAPGDHVLAVSIGVFGDRFADIAKAFGAVVEKISVPWGKAADPQLIKERIDRDIDKRIKAVLVSHNETSTGVVNDIPAIADALGDHPALFVVDTVSGLAAHPFNMDEWRVDVAASGSQKAFMIPPGLGFLAFNRRALAIHKKINNSRYYWDVSTGLEYLQKGQTPTTPAISLFYGLQEALHMMAQEGLENIISRHAFYRDLTRASIKAMGLGLLAEPEHASCSVTAVLAPPQLGANRICQAMLQQFNIVLAGGQQSLHDVIFRIGHLGYVRELDLLATVAALEIVLNRLGHPVELGTGVKVAQEYILKNQSDIAVEEGVIK